MNENYYEMQMIITKADYHRRMGEILTNQMSNTTDPMALKRLSGRRSHHRRLAREYLAQHTIMLFSRSETHAHFEGSANSPHTPGHC